MSYEAVTAGKFIVATRKDGRYFQGYIESVRALTKGTLLVIRDRDSEDGPVYKSVYLENLSVWTASHDAEYLIEDYAL